MDDERFTLTESEVADVLASMGFRLESNGTGGYRIARGFDIISGDLPKPYAMSRADCQAWIEERGE